MKVLQCTRGPVVRGAFTHEFMEKKGLFYWFLCKQSSKEQVDRIIDEQNRDKLWKKGKVPSIPQNIPRVNGISQYKKYYKEGYRYKRWLTCRDKHNLPEENLNEGAGVVPIEQPFPSGHWFPSELGKRCRSSLVYGVTKEDLI